MFSLYQNPDLDDRIFDCLVKSMAAMKAEDLCYSFLFVGDFNSHHQEWLGSTTTNRHGVAALNFTTVSGSDQLVVVETQAHGGTLDLLITEVALRNSVCIDGPYSVHNGSLSGTDAPAWRKGLHLYTCATEQVAFILEKCCWWCMGR